MEVEAKKCRCTQKQRIVDESKSKKIKSQMEIEATNPRLIQKQKYGDGSRRKNGR